MSLQYLFHFFSHSLSPSLSLSLSLSHLTVLSNSGIELLSSEQDVVSGGDYELASDYHEIQQSISQHESTPLATSLHYEKVCMNV